MSNNKQSSVEWLFQKLWDIPKDKLNWHSILKQAKAMEKEQIIKAFNEGTFATDEKITAEQYYNETFNK